MKELTYKTIAAFVGLSILYLSMAFYKLMFNPALWHEENRLIVIISGLATITLIAAFPYSSFFPSKNKNL